MAQTYASDRPVNVVAVRIALFAGVMMGMIGTFQAIAGLVAVFDDDFYVLGRSYAFEINTTTWGLIHLTFGILLGVAGFFVLSGQIWARAVGITFAVTSIISNFIFIPYYLFWSLLIITLDVLVIWALCVYGRGEAARQG